MQCHVLQDPKVVVSSCDRQNIYISVEPRPSSVGGEKQRGRKLQDPFAAACKSNEIRRGTIS